MTACFCSRLHAECDPATCELAGTEEAGELNVPLGNIGKNDCQTCDQIVRALSLPEIKAIWTQSVWDDKPNESKIGLSWAPGTRFLRTLGHEWRHFAFSLNPDSPPSLTCLALRREPKHLSPYTGSTEALGLLNSWIRTCEADHDCHRGEGTPLPRRVLNISSDQIVLEENQDQQRNALYTTLSHCWGPEGPTTKLTKATHLALTTTGVALKDLPQTFADAVLVTRQLEKDVKYIWIDSLCIFQDDLGDWQREADCMLPIYGNSYLNICAKHAANPTEGCFVDVKVDEPPHTVYPVPSSDILIREVPRLTHHDHAVHHVDTQPNPQPLLKRGWVLQERLLAPRLVYFDRDELLWECTRAHHCQCGALSTIVGFKDYWSSALSPGDITHMSKEHPICAWMKILPKYTAMQLTWESDRMIALSGVAHKVEERDVGTYVAGMWTNNLERQVTWYLTNTFGKGGEDRVAPSWSWASRKGRVAFCEAGNWNMDVQGWPDGDALILGTTIFDREDRMSGVLTVRSKAIEVTATAVMEGPPTYYRLEEGGKFIGFARGDLGGEDMGSVRKLMLLWWGRTWDGSAAWLMLEEMEGHGGYYQRFGLWPCPMIRQQKDAAAVMARGLPGRSEMTLNVL